MKEFRTACLLAGLLAFSTSTTQANSLCPLKLEKLAIVNSIEINLKAAEKASREEHETINSFKEELRRLAVSDELSLSLLKNLREGLHQHYWHSGALTTLPEYAVVKNLANLGNAEAIVYNAPSEEARTQGVKDARSFASAKGGAMPADMGKTIRDQKIKLVNSIESSLLIASYPSREVKETILTFVKEMRELALMDEVSLSSLQQIRDGLSKSGWNPTSLFEVPAYRAIRGVAEYQQLKVTIGPVNFGNGLEFVGETAASSNKLADVVLPSPDGKWIFEGGVHGASLRSLSGGEEIELAGCPPNVAAAMFFDGGKKVALTVVDNAGFGVWDTETGETLGGAFLMATTTSVRGQSIVTASSLAISADGRKIFVGTDSAPYVYVYDANSLKMLSRIDVRAPGVAQIAVKADGELAVAASGDAMHAVLFETKPNGKLIGKYDVKEGLAAMAISEAEQSVVTASIPGEIMVRALKDGSLLRKFNTNATAPEISPDGRWVANTRKSEGTYSLEVWDVSTGKVAYQFELGAGHPGSVTFSNDSSGLAVPIQNQARTEKTVRYFSL